MKRISLVLVAALALLVNACEKHSAAETSSALHTHGEGEHHAPSHDTAHGGTAADSKAPGHAQAKPEPFTPTTIPANPAGAGPSDPHDPNKDKGTGGSGDPGAYKYFPETKK